MRLLHYPHCVPMDVHQGQNSSRCFPLLKPGQSTPWPKPSQFMAKISSHALVWTLPTRALRHSKVSLVKVSKLRSRCLVLNIPSSWVMHVSLHNLMMGTYRPHFRALNPKKLYWVGLSSMYPSVLPVLHVLSQSWLYHSRMRPGRRLRTPSRPCTQWD